MSKTVYYKQVTIPDVVPLTLSYGTYVSINDYTKLFEEWNKLRDEYLEVLEENNKLKQWDVNKDSRNSRQRVANGKLSKKIKELNEEIEELYQLVGIRHGRNLITKFDLMYSHEKIKEYKKQGRTDVYGVYPDAEEVYRRYFVYKDGVESILKAIEQAKIENKHSDRDFIQYILESLKSLQDKEKEN